MTQTAIARRFFDAAYAVTRSEWEPESTPEFLLRLGFPGMMKRLGYVRSVESEEGFLRLQKLYHTLIYEAAQEISMLLTNGSIEHFFVKGVALLGRFYEPGDRTISDIDVYVDRQSREACLEVLHKLGYRALPDHDQAGPRELRTALVLRREAKSEIESHAVDLHWSIDPVERLLPGRDRDIPASFWENIDATSPVVTLTPEYHATILAHHLVHTDLLHVRNLLDLAFLFSTIPDSGGSDYLKMCRELRIGRFGSAVATITQRDLGVSISPGLASGSHGSDRLASKLDLEAWLAVSARSHPHDDEVITVPRIRRRFELVDEGCARTLWQDLLFPPASFLKWRWPGHGTWGARGKHYIQLMRKAWKR